MSVCNTAQKSLFWASSCVPGFEYVPRLACSKTISSICQSGWKEIRNAFLVICWGRLQRENWRSFPDVNNQDYGRSSFNQNVGLEFSTTSSNEWNSISKNFKKRTSRGIRKFLQTFYQQFSFHSTFLPKFLEFSVQWFASWKFNSFQNSGISSGKFPYHFAFSKHSKVLVEWKALCISDAGSAGTYSLTKTQTSKIVIWTITFNCLYCLKVLFTPWSHGSFCDHELSQICVPWNGHKACEGENRKQTRLRNVTLHRQLL